jgi:hypothetical protein
MAAALLAGNLKYLILTYLNNSFLLTRKINLITKKKVISDGVFITLHYAVDSFPFKHIFDYKG